ncbi:MAG: hypothetical protein WA063_00980 [Minisyncoccia bacterium]
MAKTSKFKNISACSVLFLLSMFTLASNVNAAVTTYRITNPIATSDFAKIVANFLKWILGVAGSIALIMLIVGGIMYMTSAGDQQKATSAKKMIMITLAGLMLVLLSYSILVVLDRILTK